MGYVLVSVIRLSHQSFQLNVMCLKNLNLKSRFDVCLNLIINYLLSLEIEGLEIGVEIFHV